MRFHRIRVGDYVGALVGVIAVSVAVSLVMLLPVLLARDGLGTGGKGRAGRGPGAAGAGAGGGGGAGGAKGAGWSRKGDQKAQGRFKSGKQAVAEGVTGEGGNDGRGDKVPIDSWVGAAECGAVVAGSGRGMGWGRMGSTAACSEGCARRLQLRACSRHGRNLQCTGSSCPAVSWKRAACASVPIHTRHLHAAMRSANPHFHALSNTQSTTCGLGSHSHQQRRQRQQQPTVLTLNC